MTENKHELATVWELLHLSYLLFEHIYTVI